MAEYKSRYTGEQIDAGIAKANTALQEHQDISGKQDILISGTNIKTINNLPILGRGNIEMSGQYVNQWSGVTIDFMGDSITEGYPGGSTVTKKYWEFLGEKLGATVHGYGIGGSTLADGANPMWSRVTTMSQADLIFVFGGTNDFALHNRLLGEQFVVSNGIKTLNVDTSTFYGGLNKLCLNLIENFPNATYVLLTPIHRKNFNGQKTDLQANTAGLYLDDYVEAIKKVGKWFSIPVIDLYSKSSLYPQDQAQKLKYFASDNDGLHPNTLGHEVLANCIYDALSTICKKLSSVSYSITKNVTNGSITGPSTISGSASLTLTANSGYALPSTITVSGAQYTYNNTTGIITLSNPTDNVVITAVCVAVTTYNITKSITNGTASGPNTIAENGAATITVDPNENYYMPDAITVTGATYTYNKTNKTIVLSNPTSDVSITVVCEYRQPTTYTITTNITNGTYSGDSTITNTGTATVTITADNDYNLPTTITVTGAQYTYNNTTGVISLSQATGNVSIKAICYQPVSTWYSDTAIDAFVGSNLSSYRTWANAGGFAVGSVASGSTENPNPPEGSHINRCRFRAGKKVNNTTGGDGSAITGSLIVGKLNTVSKEVTYVETIDLTPYNFTADRSTIREVPIAEFVIGENEVPCFWTSNIETFSCYHGQEKDVVMSSLWATITMSTSTSTQSANLVNWTGNLCFDFGYYV